MFVDRIARRAPEHNVSQIYTLQGMCCKLIFSTDFGSIANGIFKNIIITCIYFNYNLYNWQSLNINSRKIRYYIAIIGCYCISLVLQGNSNL